MPEKDFTDYICLILEAQKRVYHIIHVRWLKDTKLERVSHNGHKFVFDRDRAFLLKSWKPWKKVDRKRPIWTIRELLRSKKVGLLLFHEPIQPVQKFKEVVHQEVLGYECMLCDFDTMSERGMKSHLTKMHKASWSQRTVKTKYKEHIEKVAYYDPIPPIHISRVLQPSGKLLEGV